MTDEEYARIDKALKPFFRWAIIGWLCAMTLLGSIRILTPFFVGPGKHAEPHMRAHVTQLFPHAQDVYVSCALHNADVAGRHYCFGNYRTASGMRKALVAYCSSDPTCMQPCVPHRM